MPGLDRADGLGYGTSGRLAAAIPYKWEAAPGKPIESVDAGAALAQEPLRTPLPLPPGATGAARRPATFVAPTFAGFEPEVDVTKPSGPHFAEKVLKKLLKLRRKSKVFAAAFSLENLRALTEIKKRTGGNVSDIDASVLQSPGCSYDSDERGAGGSSWSSTSGSTFDLQPDTPSCSSSASYTSANSMSSSSSWESFSSCLVQPGSQRIANMLLSISATATSDDDDDEKRQDEDYEDDKECWTGPRECAWHEAEEDEDQLTKQEWQIVRYASMQGTSRSSNSGVMISTLVRQSSLQTPVVVDHSYQFSPIKAGRKPETR